MVKDLSSTTILTVFLVLLGLGVPSVALAQGGPDINAPDWYISPPDEPGKIHASTTDKSREVALLKALGRIAQSLNSEEEQQDNQIRDIDSKLKTSVFEFSFDSLRVDGLKSKYVEIERNQKRQLFQQMVRVRYRTGGTTCFHKFYGEDRNDEYSAWQAPLERPCDTGSLRDALGRADRLKLLQETSQGNRYFVLLTYDAPRTG